MDPNRGAFEDACYRAPQRFPWLGHRIARAHDRVTEASQVTPRKPLAATVSADESREDAVHDRMHREERSSRIAEAVTSGERRTVRRSTVRVGAVDDPAEREADRVAGELVSRLHAGPAVGLDAWARRSTRIAPMTWDRSENSIIRRAPYLFDAGRLAYRDSEAEMGDLAYFGKVQGFCDHLFLEHAATDRVHSVIEAIAREQAEAPTGRGTRRGGGGVVRPTSKYVVRSEPYLDREKKRRSLKMGDKRESIKQEVLSRFPSSQGGRGGSSTGRGAAPPADDDKRAKQLRKAVGPVYVWNGVDYTVDASRLDGPKMATIIMLIAEKGPKAMIEGAGSRLPDPRGTVYTLGDIPRTRIFRILGVEEEPDGTFTNVNVKALDADRYVDKLDKRTERGDNIFNVAWEPTGLFMFYASTVPPSSTSNRVIQINGTVYTVDELPIRTCNRASYTPCTRPSPRSRSPTTGGSPAPSSRRRGAGRPVRTWRWATGTPREPPPTPTGSSVAPSTSPRTGSGYTSVVRSSAG